jgi:DNA-nicking Smr family endonuclease
MKRPRSSPTLNVSARGSARPGMSEDDRLLWESVARHVKPLRTKKRTGKHSAIPTSEPPSARPVASKRPVRILEVPKPDKPATPPLMPLGRRERARLSRGRNEIEARLDLHGMTQIRAHRALLGFLQRAHRDGLTFVLIITGKGKIGGIDSERGVLRRLVPHWLALLELRALVAGFEEAHVGHGGEGALYVRVRRAKA